MKPTMDMMGNDDLHQVGFSLSSLSMESDLMTGPDAAKTCSLSHFALNWKTVLHFQMAYGSINRVRLVVMGAIPFKLCDSKNLFLYISGMLCLDREDVIREVLAWKAQKVAYHTWP